MHNKRILGVKLNFAKNLIYSISKGHRLKVYNYV